MIYYDGILNQLLFLNKTAPFLNHLRGINVNHNDENKNEMHHVVNNENKSTYASLQYLSNR